jgi:hypothetical protein
LHHNFFRGSPGNVVTQQDSVDLQQKSSSQVMMKAVLQQANLSR